MTKGKKVVVVGLGLLVAHLILKEQRKKEPNIAYVNKLPFGYNAQTLPPFGILIKKEHARNANLLQHELIHWRQYQRQGLLLYYLNYLANQLQHGYDNNPMEVEARVNESDYCRTHYTECVRAGKAATLHDPNFRLWSI